jgi:putative transposase
MIEEATVEYPEVSLSALCELFGVSRSWYYQRPKVEQEKAKEDLALRDAIRAYRPGVPWLRLPEGDEDSAARRMGYVNHKRVLRVMRQESLLCQLKRRFVPTTDSAHSFKGYPNLIGEATLDGPDQ